MQHPPGKVPGKLLLHKGISQKASSVFWISSHSSQIKVGRSSGGSRRREAAHPSQPASLAHRHKTAPAWPCEGHEVGFVPLLGCRAIGSPLCRCGGQHKGEQGTKYRCSSAPSAGPAEAGTRVSSNLDPQNHRGHGEFRLGTLHSATLAEPCGTALGSTMPQNPGTACWDLLSLPDPASGDSTKPWSKAQGQSYEVPHSAWLGHGFPGQVLTGMYDSGRTRPFGCSPQHTQV